jgi:tRNA U34 5-methylaminomethyl-2-thiouridine-forming methyltransferase MnmC
LGYDEQYHSVNGAIGESMHVFIRSGFDFICPESGVINILEVGLGTGLNALLTAKSAMGRDTMVYYHAFEAYPLDNLITGQLNYCQQIHGDNLPAVFEGIHSSSGDTYKKLLSNFFIKTSVAKIQDAILEKEHYHLVYFDAFGPDTQPEMWTSDVFEKIYESMITGAVLVTYCAKGIVRRAMTEVGLKVEKIPGPPGKREISRAIKP